MATYSLIPELANEAMQAFYPNEEEILQQLERIVKSSHFRNSKRYPALLRFIVEETLAGRSESLKERTLGIEVFGRPHDYDTGLDPVVRVSAGEIRKRIAQYYQESQNTHEVRFDLPLGSYVPRFCCSLEHLEIEAHCDEPAGTMTPLLVPALAFAPDQTAAVHGVEQDALPGASDTSRVHAWFRVDSSKLMFVSLLFLSTIVAALLVKGFLNHPKQDDGVSFFWNPILNSKEDALIVIGVHALDEHGRDLSPASSIHSSPYQSMLSSMTSSEMVSISDVLSYSSIVRMLTLHSKNFRSQSAAETTIADLRRGPVLLIGGFNNSWMMRLSSKLRFRLIAESESLHGIQDSEHPKMIWDLDNAQNALTNSRDFAIVGCIFDPQIEQYVVFVSGIGKSGTEAGAEFLTDSNYLQTWFSKAHLALHENVEVVLSTETIEGKHGPPHVIASSSW